MISIIVPVYNAEKYICRCIESVLRQTYGNYELLLIDDGSKDKSGEICKEYEKNDNRIKYFHKENEGPGATRVYGAKKAEGDYIFFLDSDDYLADDALKLLLESFEDDIDCVIGQHKRFGNVDNIKQVSFPAITVDIKNSDKDFAKTFLGGKVAMFGGELWNKLFRAERVKNACSDEIRFKFGEDTFYLITIFANCGKILCIEDTTYFYEFRNDSLARSTENSFMLPEFAKECIRLQDGACRNKTVKDAYPLVTAYMLTLAIYKYSINGAEEQLEKDFEKLYSMESLRKTAFEFLNNKNMYKSRYKLRYGDYELIYCIYKTIYKRNIWYFKRLHPAMATRNRKTVFFTYIKRMIKNGKD